MGILRQYDETLAGQEAGTSSRVQKQSGQRLSARFQIVITLLGVLVCFHAIYHLTPAQLDLRYLVITMLTLAFGSRVFVQLPGVNSQISVSDTFVFLTILMFGGEPAILLAGADAVCTARRVSKKKKMIFFNAAVLLCSTFLTVWTLRAAFGDLSELSRPDYSSTFIVAICLMGLTQYAANSGLVAISVALRAGQPLWQMWRKNFLWTSITYFAGASAAGLIAKLIGFFGLYAFLATAPIIAIIYFTYSTYLKNIEASARQAEQAERHVEELSHYIAEQERLREQFSQLEKMSALGQLASGVAHDFNNCLAAIMGRAQALERHVDDPKIRHSLEVIIQAAEDGASTVKRIQDFARHGITTDDFGLVDADQLLLDVSEISSPRWKDSAEAQKIRISMELKPSSGAVIKGDASELRDVLVNMIFNAVDAMPQGGRITLSSKTDNNWVVISVKDTGTGMSPDVRSRVFEPFFTTKGMAGMGLGLAVSYGAVRRHAGEIEIDSEVGRGTTFRIKLPFAGRKEDVREDATEVLSKSKGFTAYHQPLRIGDRGQLPDDPVAREPLTNGLGGAMNNPTRFFRNMDCRPHP